MAPNRVVAITAAIIALLLAALPVVADMDWTSTAGVIAGVVAVLGIVQKWLDGWQKFEARRVAPTPAGFVGGNSMTASSAGDGVSLSSWSVAPARSDEELAAEEPLPGAEPPMLTPGKPDEGDAQVAEA